MPTLTTIIPAPSQPLPTNLSYGGVIWRAQAILPDSADIGSNPDPGVFQGVTVKLEPVLGVYWDATATPAPVSLFPQVYETGLNSAGYLLNTDGNVGMVVVAKDPDLAPTELSGWYRVSIEGTGRTITPFYIEVTAGSTVNLGTYVRDGQSLTESVPSPTVGSGITGLDAETTPTTVKVIVRTGDGDFEVDMPVASDTQAGVPTAEQIDRWDNNVGGAVSAGDITDATTVGEALITAADKAAARAAIDAGTSNLTIGTTSSTAKAGNYSPPTASDTVAGLVERATNAEVTAATDTSRYVSPAGLAVYLTSQIGGAGKLVITDPITGLINSALLPGGIGDFSPFDSVEDFPSTGDEAVLYFAEDSLLFYRWVTGLADYQAIPTSPGSTDDVPEGVTNKYWSNAKFDNRLSSKIGNTVQAFHANLAALAGVASPVANRFAYWTNTTTMGLATLTTVGREWLGLSDKAAMKAYLETPPEPFVGTLAEAAADFADDTSTTKLFLADRGNGDYAIFAGRNGIFTQMSRSTNESGTLVVAASTLQTVVPITSTTFQATNLSFQISQVYNQMLLVTVDMVIGINWAAGSPAGTQFGVGVRVVDGTGRVLRQALLRWPVTAAAGNAFHPVTLAIPVPASTNLVGNWGVQVGRSIASGWSTNNGCVVHAGAPLPVKTSDDASNAGATPATPAWFVARVL